MSTKFEAAVAGIAERYVGPGGALAVLRDGEVLAQHTWGYADLERRLPYTAQSPHLICSISKQFTCALLLDQCPDLDALDEDVRRMLPKLTVPAPGVRDLANNQSGLRDYWAAAMLTGPAVEGRFTLADATRLIRRTQTLHFAPGTRYSYCNQNFRILSDIIEDRTGRDYGTLLRERLFDRVGMPRAALNADTSSVIGGTRGYEGTVEAGFRPAVNRIVWTGDAGIAASLEDLIAWEKHIDATRDDPDALYSRLAAPVTFRDGRPAGYGFGLARGKLLGRDSTSHGGGLRGWVSFRAYIPAERVSVIVLFNHMANCRAAAVDLLTALFDEPAAEAPAAPTLPTGRFIEPETGLAVRVDPPAEGKLRLLFGPSPDMLSPDAEGGWSSGGTRLHQDGETLRMDRAVDNLSAPLTPVSGTPTKDINGAYRNDELDSVLHIASLGGALYARFTGELGEGITQPLLPYATDIWLYPCPRALDHGAPGDWTLSFNRDGNGTITGVTVGCWLARGIAFTRT